MTETPRNGQGRGSALLERAATPGLIFRPRVDRVGQNKFRIVGMRDDANTTPWGFWGGILAMTVGTIVLAYQGLTGLWAIWDLVGALAAMTVGLLMMRFGAHSSLLAEPCAEIDLQAGTLRLLASTDVALPEIKLEDVDEVVFGMTRYPVSNEPGAVKVHAFSLLVRHSSDVLIPVVEASPDKDALYGVARFIAKLRGLGVTQVGLGIK